MKNKLIILTLVMTSMFLQGCYVIKQGMGQFKLQFSQVPLEEAIENEPNGEYRKLLAAVPAIKQFAVEQLCLKSNKNYTSYYATQDTGVSFVVTAAPKTKLEPYTWWFPIIGSVPYKGFFDEAEALELEQDLTSRGYDTYRFAAPAYSTLGWFKDPITTPMLKRGYFALASTIIHEMVHTTKYIEGQGDFNEQLASFIEYKGARSYFEQNNLLDGKQLQDIESSRQNRIQLLNLIQTYLKNLDELYKSTADEAVILEKREDVFARLSEEIVRLYPHNPKTNWRFNNARLLQYKRYDEDSQLLNNIWEQSDGDWKKFWQLVENYTVQQGWEG
ncbi:aminopeptidase [bacterium]|nr:aminopeptidase [bacterium]